VCEAYLEQGLVVTDVNKLRRNYMYTWQFPVDVVSLLPTDLLYLSSSRYLTCLRSLTYLYNVFSDLLHLASSCYLTCLRSLTYLYNVFSDMLHLSSSRYFTCLRSLTYLYNVFSDLLHLASSCYLTYLRLLTYLYNIFADLLYLSSSRYLTCLPSSTYLYNVFSDLLYLFFGIDFAFVRINRVLRVGRMLEFFDRTDSRTNYPHIFRVLQLVIYMIVSIHWNACLYYQISAWIGLGTDEWVRRSLYILI